MFGRRAVRPSRPQPCFKMYATLHSSALPHSCPHTPSSVVAVMLQSIEIPLDILDLLADEIALQADSTHDTLHDLATYHLVNNAFAYCFARRVFNHIEVSDGFPWHVNEAERRLAELLALLKRNPTIGNCVRSLTIKLNKPDADHVPTIIPPILKRLKHVQAVGAHPRKESLSSTSKVDRLLRGPAEAVDRSLPNRAPTRDSHQRCGARASQPHPRSTGPDKDHTDTIECALQSRDGAGECSKMSTLHFMTTCTFVSDIP